MRVSAATQVSRYLTIVSNIVRAQANLFRQGIQWIKMAKYFLVQIASYENPITAHIVRSRLESEGIQATLDGENHVAMDWMITNAVGGVKLLVKESDREAAARILIQQPEDSNHGIIDESVSGKTVNCPHCGTAEVYRERLRRKWIYLSILLLGIPIPFLSNRLICDLCGHDWTYIDSNSEQVD